MNVISRLKGGDCFMGGNIIMADKEDPIYDFYFVNKKKNYSA